MLYMVEQNSQAGFWSLGLVGVQNVLPGLDIVLLHAGCGGRTRMFWQCGAGSEQLGRITMQYQSQGSALGVLP